MDLTWFDIAIICPVIFGIYYVQQIKIALKTRGEFVSMFGGWYADYRRIKDLAASEGDETVRVQYQRLVSGLHLSVGFLVLLVVLRFAGKI
jgi:uncharacterized membrane protein YobD (UPF0266 family)